MTFGDFMANALVVLDHGKKQIGPVLAEASRGLDDFGKTKLGPAMGATGASLQEFSQTTLLPVMAKVGTHLDEFGKTKLGPAMSEMGKGLDDFGKNQLAPAMGVAGAALENFGRTNLVPAMAEAGKKLDDFGKNQLGPAIGQTAATIGEFGNNQVAPAITALVEEHGPAVGEATRQTGKWVQANPKKTTLIAGTAVSFLLPGIISSPLLWAFGFGSKGPVAGSAAAAIQSTAGNVASKSVFAVAQSSAMGGYGTGITSLIVRVGSAVFATATGFWPGESKKEGDKSADNKH